MSEKFPQSDPGTAQDLGGLEVTCYPGEAVAPSFSEGFDFDKWVQARDEEEAYLRRQTREEAFLNGTYIVIFGV